MSHATEFNQLSFEEDAVHAIRTFLATANRHLQTSMMAHGRPTESTYQIAVALGEEVAALKEALPESVHVQRWARKYEEFVKQHGLDEPRVGD